jgi:hypothetical protein
MADETLKAEETSKTPGGTVYHQVAPAGVAAEVTADDPVAAGAVAALGRWLTEKLAASPAARERVATLSGLSATDLTALMDGHPLFRLDTDHVQRIATALVEAQVIPQADEVWEAMGSEAGPSEYIVPPTQVVRAMSGNP